MLIVDTSSWPMHKYILRNFLVPTVTVILKKGLPFVVSKYRCNPENV